MKNQIIEASEILNDKFKITPKDTKLFLYDNIAKFLNKTKNPQAQSIFLPKNLSAHCPDDRLDLVLHEYFGHGLYCEYTPYGKSMVKDERNFDYMNEKDKKKKLNLHEIQKPNFEGHALWTEDFLLTKLGKRDILEKRLNELNNLVFRSNYYTFKTQKEVYERIKEFEENNGTFEMWYSLGFPRQFDKNTLLEISKEKLNSRFNDLRFLVHFGSNNPYGDIDLCAILEDNIDLDEYCHSNTIDLPQHNYSKFIEKLNLFDITITQPLLTGKLIYGNKKEFGLLKQKLLKTKPDDKSVKYLKNRSKCSFKYARDYLKKSDTRFGFEVSLNDLSYSLSFYDLVF